MSNKDKRRHIVVYERNLKHIVVTSVPIVREFKVYYHGWGSDGIGYVVERNGRKCVVLTNHGTTYFADTTQLAAMALELVDAVAILNEVVLDCTG